MEVWSGEKLNVTVPPPKAIAASKLVRGDDRDFEDCLWLMAAHGIGAKDIMAAIRGLPKDPRKKATENLGILTIMKP